MLGTKYTCSECDWHGFDALRAPNPFDVAEDILGCPKCKSAETLRVACDELECWREVTCGTPTPRGYRQTCGEHRPQTVTS